MAEPQQAVCAGEHSQHMPGMPKQQVQAFSNADWQRVGHQLRLPCTQRGQQPGCPDSTGVYLHWVHQHHQLSSGKVAAVGVGMHSTGTMGGHGTSTAWTAWKLEATAPVPEPMAPMKSAMMVRAPMHMPPKAAAVGM